jgi:peroxiredoxin Q/BCP
MKHLIAVLFVLTCTTIVRANPQDFTVTSPDGKTFKLSDAKGKYVALHFLLKTECPFCLKHTHNYALHSPEVAGVVHVFLKPDSASEIQKWTKDIDPRGIELPTIYQDENAKLANDYDIKNGFKFHGQVVHYPALVLLDPAGKEVFRYTGKDNTDRYSFEQFTGKMGELWAGELKSQHLDGSRLAIQGYDPVSYVTDNKAVAGDEKITSMYRDAIYRFTSTDHQKRFAADPDKFAPQYGGWCAAGLSHGDKIDIDPQNFKVTNGRLFLFCKGPLGDGLDEWNKDETGLTKQADQNWPKLAN